MTFEQQSSSIESEQNAELEHEIDTLNQKAEEVGEALTDADMESVGEKERNRLRAHLEMIVNAIVLVSGGSVAAFGASEIVDQNSKHLLGEGQKWVEGGGISAIGGLLLTQGILRVIREWKDPHGVFSRQRKNNS